LSNECERIKRRWEGERSLDHIDTITAVFPDCLPFADVDLSGSDPNLDLPWNMASDARDRLTAETEMERMMDKFIRWVLVNSAGSWSPHHTDAAGSYTVGRVVSGYKLWIVFHLEEGHHYANRKVDCLLLKASDRL
jgi:hypothetical protein